MLDEWSGDDADELFELIDTQLGDVGVDVKFEKHNYTEELAMDDQGKVTQWRFKMADAR